MRSYSLDHVIGIPVISVQYASEELSGKPGSTSDSASHCRNTGSYGSSQSKKNKLDSVYDWMSKVSKNATTRVQGIQEHVSLAPNFSQTVKAKLSLGTRILQAGGVKRVFRQNFSVGKAEKLLYFFQCYLSTTAGPISGLLYISTEKIAFHSDRFLTLTSPRGKLARVPYKVSIPLRKIKIANSSENPDKRSQKYIQIVTKDEFEFWFMGFVSYSRSFKYLLQAISLSQEGFQ